MSLVTLLSSTIRTASDTGGAIELHRGLKGLVFLLNVTAGASTVSDTLDCYVQDSIDGVTYDDLVHFTQVLGNSPIKKFKATVSCEVTPTIPQAVPQSLAMSAGARQGPVGQYLRGSFVVAGGTAKSFTFSLTMVEIR